MKKVLMIAYFFPPLGGAGVQRTLKFAKYLPKFGWDPIVLTQKNGHHFAYDYEQLKDIPKDTKVVRGHSLEAAKLRYLIKNALLKILRLGAQGKTPEAGAKEYSSVSKNIFILRGLRKFVENWIFIPDSKIRWFPDALLKGFKLAKYKHVKVIYSTSYPYTCHILGYFIKKLTGKHWVADFRDPWADNIYMTKHLSPLRKKIDRWLESKVVQNADRIVLCTQPIYESFWKKYHYEDSKKFSLITNGYDEADFPGLKEEKAEKFTILYTGVLAEPCDPGLFFKAIEQIMKEKPTIISDWEVLFLGYMGDSYQKEVAQMGLGDVVNVKRYIPRKECMRLMMKSSVLLLTISENMKGQGMFTSKIFDYLVSRKPILAIVPDDIAANLIRETGAGIVVEPQDKQGIINALLSSYSKFKKGTLVPNRTPLPLEHSRFHLTKKLSIVLNEINCS